MKGVKDRIIRNKFSIIAFSLYLPVTIVLTYPVVFKIGTDVPGIAADQLQWMRILWYTKIPLLNPEITSFTHDRLLFYPDGISSMPLMSAFNQILYIFLSPFFQLPVIYTMLWLLTFYLSACGAFLLVRYLTGNDFAALISGILFAFSSYHFSRGLYFFGAATIQWIPFCALYLMKMYKEGGIKNSVVAGLFFLLIAMSDLQNMVFMGIFVILLFIYETYGALSPQSNGKSPERKFPVVLKNYCVFGIVAFCGMIPLFFHDITIAVSGENFLKPLASHITLLSNDLVSFFTPSPLHPVFGPFVPEIYSRIPSWLPEKVNYIGYTVLALSIFVFFTSRKNSIVKFWLITAGVFSLLSLGPLLRIQGESVFTIFKTTIPLPYIILYYTIPFVDNCRTVGRFFVIATLAFSVLSGYGLALLMRSHERKRQVLVSILSVLLIFSCLSIPYPTTPVMKPKFYTDISTDTDHYALLELPLTSNGGNLGFNAIYYQTIHGKAIVGGYAARYPSGTHNFQKNTPFIRELAYLMFFDDILQQSPEIVGTSILNYYNIRYIVIHTDEMSDDELLFTVNLIESTMKTEPILYKNDLIVVYQVPERPLTSFIILNDGWYGLNSWNGTPTRWMSENATFLIYSDKDQMADFVFSATSYYQPRALELYLGDMAVGNYTVNNGNFDSISTSLQLKGGINIVRLQIPQSCDRPVDMKESSDSRCLSIAVQNVSLSPFG